MTGWNCYLVTDKLEEIGLDPLVDLLSGQGGWPMVEEAWNPDSFNLSTALNNLRNLNVYPLISAFVNLDAFNTSRWLIYVSPSDLYFYYMYVFLCFPQLYLPLVLVTFNSVIIRIYCLITQSNLVTSFYIPMFYIEL